MIILLHLLLLTVAPFLLLCAGLNHSGDDSETFLINAIVGKNNISTAECWAIEPGFQISNVARTVGDQVLALGNISNSVMIIIPDDNGMPNNGGLHNGAHAQWVFALTGGVNVSFPQAPGGFSVGAGGLFISSDILGTSTFGHQSIWAAGSRFIQAPFPGGVVVNHTVVAEHACEER
ncbi:hypothetical protein B0H16DRAFT_1467279 [Mycena metata]|uniref:Uncharacterized protein n=1 Tax=Mycena metata TaxID=1033252 RepID=A0AAD7I4S7_9AGAR|nr:hypothetical protein B0H16DRAFT_1467279 [Mycena metata]